MFLTRLFNICPLFMANHPPPRAAAWFSAMSAVAPAVTLALAAFCAPLAAQTKTDAQFLDFNTLSAAGNNQPEGIWSDGATMWVTDDEDEKLYAYKMSDMTRDAAKDISNSGDALPAPNGITATNDTIYVLDRSSGRNNFIRAYKRSDRTRDAGKDIDLGRAGVIPNGIYTDGTTIWYSNNLPMQLRAYTLSTRARDSAKDISVPGGFPRGLSGDGTYIYVLDSFGNIKAYNISTKAEDTSRRVTGLPGGRWGLHVVGNIAYVSTQAGNFHQANNDDKIHAYNIAANARATRPFLRFSAEAATEGSPIVITATTHKADGTQVAAPLDVEWRWKTVDGTAMKGSDYTASNFSTGVSISAGSSVETISIPTVDDTTFESPETFTVDMTQLTNATFDFNTAAGNQVVTVTINDNDGVAISEPAAAVTEGQPLQYIVTLDMASATGTTVTYATVFEDATPHASAGADATNQDYEPTTTSGGSLGDATLVIPPGRSTATITIATIDDMIDEEDTEVFGVLLKSYNGNPLSGGTNCATSDLRACGFINDNDDPPFLVADPVSALEDSNLEFTVRMVNAAGAGVTSEKLVTGQWQVINDGTTATINSDFTILGGGTVPIGLTISIGTSTEVFTATLIDDNDNEGNETIAAQIDMPTNARFMGGATAITVIGTILDNDLPTVAIVADATRVTEGDDVVFTINAMDIPTGGLNVPVTVSEAGNYAASGEAGNRMVNIPGGSTSAKLTARTDDDNTDEGNGTITATLGTLPTSHRPAIENSATVIIEDNEEEASISVPDTVPTSDTADNVVITLTLEPDSGEARGPVTEKQVSTVYETMNGTAKAGTDYTAIPTTTLVFEPGTNTAHITVDIIGPDADEDDDSFRILFLSAHNATFGGLGSKGVDVVIQEKPSFSITADASVTEGETAVFTVILSMPHDSALSVPISVAQTGNVTRFTGTTVTFPPGETRRLFNVPTIADNIDEPDGSITATIGVLPDTHTGTGSSATLTVNDDDRAPVIAIDDTHTTEGQPLIFNVRLSNPSTQAITVDYATLASGMAMAGSASANDYQDIQGTLTFPPLSISQQIRVITYPDDIADPDETVVVLLSNPSMHATLAANPTATGTIREGLDAEQMNTLNAAVAPRLASALGGHIAGILGDRVYAALAGRPSAPGFAVRGAAPAAFLAALGRVHQSNYRDKLSIGAHDLAFTAPVGGRPSLDLGSLTVWGRGYHSETDYEADTAEGLRFDGDVKGVLLGMDARSDDLMLGLALNHTRAELDYHLGILSGTHHTELAGIHPYIGRTVAPQTRVWGGLGLNNGVLEVKEDNRSTKFNINLRATQLGADVGLRNATGHNGDYRFAARAELRHARMTGRPQGRAGGIVTATDFATDNLAARAGVSYAYSRALAEGGEWGANTEVNLRHERGAGVTGNGIELGGGVKYHLGGVRAHLDARALAAHSKELKEWTVSGGLTWFAPQQRGWGVSFAPHWGSQNTAGYQLEAQYGIGFAAEHELLTLFARENRQGQAHHGHHYSLGADYHIGADMTAGYEAVIEPDTRTGTDHRGYIRYRWRF